MGFTIPFFLFVFFPLCVGGYYLTLGAERLLPFIKRWQLGNLFILAASMVFYGWGVLGHVPYLLGYVLVVFLLGKLIEHTGRRGALCLVTIGIILLLGVLYVYKYREFTVITVNSIAGREMLSLRPLIAPLGISFITFSAISYIVDIYRGDAKAGHLTDAALYLTFFPKIISGPIVQWRDFGEQIGRRTVSAEKFVSGLNRIMIGFGKKLILADSLGVVCVDIQNAVESGIDVPTAWGCAFLYMLQIYYDFAGYSDIAIGLARIFGFEIRENFNFPYIATSITEFWRRWHISLGTWYKEYLYIPLGGSRRGKGRTILNLAIVFLLTGVWHGAGWGYLCWGAMHGLCRMLEKAVEGTKFDERFPRPIRYVLTMFVVMMGWETFRLSKFEDLTYFLQIMFGKIRFDWIPFTFAYYFNAKVLFLTAVAVAGATVFALRPIRTLPRKLSGSPAGFVVQELGLLLLMALAVVFMINSTYSPFIYFQY